MDIYINLKELHTRVIESSSGIFTGENRQTGWRAVQKTNQGLGAISGKTNISYHNVNVVNDPDLVDSPIRKAFTKEEKRDGI